MGAVVTTFGIGFNAQRAEFRASDYAGRPVDPAAETETARTERIRALQDRWTERQLPSADPAECLREWAARDPANRMSELMQRIASQPDLLPDAESESPGRPMRPGGLLERMSATRSARQARGTVM